VETNLRRDGNENSLDLMVILLLFFTNIICVEIPSEKFYQALSSQNLKMFTNLLWVVIWHHSNIWMGKFVKCHHWTLWGIKKGLHNMLSSLLIWIIQNMLTLDWQVNIITMNGHMKFCMLVLRTWISNLLALLLRCIIRVLKHQSMCLLLVLSSITPSLIKCKYNIVLKLEKWFPT
jgi:hypothetical protein